jgi:hypothetical protein
MRLRNLIVIDVLLLALALPGMLNVLFKNHASNAESVVAWISLVAFAGGVLALLVIGLRALRGTSARP